MGVFIIYGQRGDGEPGGGGGLGAKISRHILRAGGGGGQFLLAYFEGGWQLFNALFLGFFSHAL